MNDIEDADHAEHVLNNLRRKREALVARGQNLAQERAELSYAAHTGDKPARQKLDKLNAEAALHDSELRSLDSAIAEAIARVERAHQAEAQAADRARANEARELADEMAKVFPYLDRHLTEAARSLIAIHNGVTRLHALGFAAPSDAQVRLGIAAIIQTWAHKLPPRWHDQLRDGLQFLAPHERKTATQYFAAIKPALDNQIAQRLGEASKEEAA